jgi:hypothetical protein
MYMYRARLAPAWGKTAEAKRLLADHVKHLQGQGQRFALSELIFSTEGPMLIVTQFAAELDGIEAARKSRLTDSDFRTRANQWGALLREPPRSSLWEGIVDPLPNPPPTAIGQIAFFYPALGHDRQVEGVLREFVGELRHMGQRVSLWRRLYSSDGPMIQALGRYADLSDLDRARKARSDVAARTTATVVEISRAPVRHRLTETIVPLPPA